MDFTNEHVMAFFINQRQIVSPSTTLSKLLDEGIQTHFYFIDFVKEDMKVVVSIPRKSSGKIPIPIAVDDNAQPARIPRIPCIIGAKSLKHLKIAAEAVRYYKMMRR